MLHLFLFLVTVLSLIFLIVPNYRKHEKLNPPPGPKGLPVIGNLHQLDSSAPIYLYFSKLAKIYGPIVSLRFGCRSMVVVQSASLAKEVLKTQDHNFCTRPALVGQQRLSKNGSDLALAPYGEYYREMRKLCVIHLFSSKKVQSFSPIRKEEISRMIQKISSMSFSSEIINLSELFYNLTRSIVCRSALGKRYNDEGDEMSRFHTLFTQLEALAAAFFFSDYFPFVGIWIDKLSGLSFRLERVTKDMDQFLDQVINDHLDPNRPKHDHHDFLDVLLQLQKESCFLFDLTLDHIKALLLDVIVAGTDTSASMIVWAMVELMRNPMVMRKVQDELRAIIQGKSFIEEEDLSKLQYFKAMVKETFRLHPALPLLIVREALEKCTIEEYDILPKTLVYVNVWVIGRDPKSWEKPEEFMPERFLKSSLDFKGKNFDLIPFRAGRRMCPGINMGIANFETTLANLLYSFDWELPTDLEKEDIDNDVIPGVIVLHKKNPLCLVAKKFSPVM